MEERFSLLIKVEHKAHWVIDLCHRHVWCLARNGEREREREREAGRQTDRQAVSQTVSQTDRDSHVLSHGLCPSDAACQHAPTYVTVWVRLPKSTLILPFVCVMIKNKRGGVNTKEKRIFPFPCYLKMTPIVLFVSLFCLVGSWGEG